MSIDDRIAKFFVTATDLEIPGEQVPVTSSENRVTHLIDGSEYFGALRSEVEALKGPGIGNRFFYFTDWILMLIDFAGTPSVGGLPSAWNQDVKTDAFHLDDSSGAAFPLFLDDLGTMAANNVDVRALAWASPYALAIRDVAKRETRYNNYAATLLSIKALREKPGMAHKACLDLVAHPVGAVHLKMVVCGDDTNARGYTSGLDFEFERVDNRQHPNGVIPSAAHPTKGFGWHDVATKLEGSSVDTLYRYFQLLWNEQIARKVETFRFKDATIASHDDQTPQVSDRTFLAIPNGSHHVQVLRTAPQMHLAVGSTTAVPANCLFRLVAGASRPSLSFAQDGIFEFRAALKKAISAAETYIYVEDQAFTGREIMDWIHDRLVGNPNLKVIFVYGGDPTDPPEERVLLNMAVNEHLAPVVPDVGSRVAFYFRIDGVVVHSKTWIIDDEFVVIGSANAMRRSLYMDVELAAGVLDENEGLSCFPVSYRSDLWAEHCQVTPPSSSAAFNDLDMAIRIWDSSWSISGAAGAPPGTLGPFLVRRRVPFSNGPAPDQFSDAVDPKTGALVDPVILPTTPQERSQFDTLYDVADGDSRQEY